MGSKKHHIIILACLLLLTVVGEIMPAKAQPKPALEYQVKAAFLFNFTRFVHWPAFTYASADAPFIIGITGNDPFGTYLDDLVNGEQVDGRRIVVKRYTDAADMHACQLLFVGTTDASRLKDIITMAAHQGILTVGDADNFTKSGGMVGFFKEDSRVKIEIKLAAAKAAQLEISAKLLQVAKVK